MQKMDFSTLIDKIYPLPLASRNVLMNSIEEVRFPKGHILIKSEIIDQNIYFIKKGIVRAFVNIDGSDVTFWFGQEGDTVFSINGYVKNKKGYECIELLEDCEFYKLKNTAIQALFEEDIHIANWGRKHIEYAMIETEERLISRLIKTATESYSDLLENEPILLKRVSLKHIASYLGITQVSLSRIRAKK